MVEKWGLREQGKVRGDVVTHGGKFTEGNSQTSHPVTNSRYLLWKLFQSCPTTTNLPGDGGEDLDNPTWRT